MILPVGATSFTEAMRMGSETYHHLSGLIKAKYGQDATAVGDEGGFAPNFQNNADAIQVQFGVTCYCVFLLLGTEQFFFYRMLKSFVRWMKITRAYLRELFRLQWKTKYLFFCLQLCKDAIEKAGYTGKIMIGMDVAASEFYKDGKYDLDFKNKNSNPDDWLDSGKLGDMYKEFINDAPVVSIEDPFDQVWHLEFNLSSIYSF